jgi:putative hemolysin
MKKTTTLIILIAALMVLAGCKPNNAPVIGGDKDSHGCLIGAGYSWCDVKQKCLRTWEENCTTDQQLVGNDKDSHGCIGSAGYSWCDVKQKCLRTWEENCTTESSCTCPQGYVKEGDACNPKCYYSNPKCLMPSIQCSAQENTGIANPASVYCEANGGKLDIITAVDGSQSGQCTLPNGTVCDEWAYFRGECPANKECGECPQLMPPGPQFCKTGKIVAGETDECGCTGAPKCEQVMCTADAKICPDGTGVGRIPPDCEFAQCP